jgi:Secretion system C-terminal sorting domain
MRLLLLVRYYSLQTLLLVVFFGEAVAVANSNQRSQSSLADNRYYGITTWYSYAQNSTDANQFARFYVRGNNTILPYKLVINGFENPPLSTPVFIQNLPNTSFNYSNNFCNTGGGGETGRLMSNAKQIATDVLYPVSDKRNRFVSRKQLLNNMEKEAITITGDADIDAFPTMVSNEAVGKFNMVDKLAQQGIDNADMALVSQAESLNQSILTSDNIEELQKQVNEVYLRYVITGGVLNPAQISLLKSIAALCPYTDGTSIWQARALLVGVDNTEYFNMCEYYGEPSANTSNARMTQVVEDIKTEEPSLVAVYPNPNNGSFKIELPVCSTELSIEIISSVGTVIKQIKHTPIEGDTILNVQDLTQGLYFVIVKQNGVSIATNKVIVTK